MIANPPSSPQQIEIRPLGYADLPHVIAIERRSFPTPWSLAMFVLELSKPSGICLAAVRGGRLVGYAVCSRYDAVWHLMNIAVDLGCRRRGIATALLAELFRRGDGPGERYTLEVRMSNRPGIRLYEGFGFRPGGRRPGYYRDNREDALIMWRTAGGAGRGGAGRDYRGAVEVPAKEGTGGGEAEPCGVAVPAETASASAPARARA